MRSMARSGAPGLRRPNDPPVLILTSLAGGPKHGHALLKDIEDFAGITLGPAPCTGRSPALKSAA